MAGTRATVLILLLGETGTGKSRFAQHVSGNPASDECQGLSLGKLLVIHPSPRMPTIHPWLLSITVILTYRCKRDKVYQDVQDTLARNDMYTCGHTWF